ncbi:MAG: (deoxy)nucleoside triphosphate pyrophosphohydrolase [Clostridia bacterium]|nr:(deoxy)nucleoside triphosphate pyrophosphohydrolase [Deltaproteobacteria bacterium]
MNEKRRICVVSAAIAKEGAYLITQRSERAVLPLKWEFPGGKVEEGEYEEAALTRELRERLGITPDVGALISTTVHEYDDYTVELKLYDCKVGPIAPRIGNVRDMRWVASHDFGKYEFTPADQESMDRLLFGEKH